MEVAANTVKKWKKTSRGYVVEKAGAFLSQGHHRRTRIPVSSSIRGMTMIFSFLDDDQENINARENQLDVRDS